MYVVVKNISVHFIHVAEDQTLQHVGVVIHNAQSGGGRRKKKKNARSLHISV